MSAHIVNDVVEGAVAAVLLLVVTMGAHIVNYVVEGAVAVNARRAAAFYADVCFSYEVFCERCCLTCCCFRSCCCG